MKAVWLRAILIFMCCVARSADAFALPSELSKAAVVKPGRSVGRVALGMRRESVRKMLGKPVSSEGSKHDEWWEFSEDEIPAPQTMSMPYITVDYVGGKVVQIAARLKGVVAPDNFSVHSTLSQIQRRFKGIKRTASYDVVDVKEIFYSHAKQGIGFDFTSESGKVLASDEPDCFIVFKPGRRIIPSWFSDNTVHPH